MLKFRENKGFQHSKRAVKPIDNFYSPNPKSSLARIYFLHEYTLSQINPLLYKNPHHLSALLAGNKFPILYKRT